MIPSDEQIKQIAAGRATGWADTVNFTDWAKRVGDRWSDNRILDSMLTRYKERAKQFDEATHVTGVGGRMIPTKSMKGARAVIQMKIDLLRDVLLSRADNKPPKGKRYES